MAVSKQRRCRIKNTFILIVIIIIIIVIIIIIIIISCELFTPANADGLSLESEWQQVSSSLRNSSQYSGWL